MCTLLVANSSFTYFHWQFPPQQLHQIKAKHNFDVTQHGYIQNFQTPLCVPMRHYQNVWLWKCNSLVHQH